MDNVDPVMGSGADMVPVPRQPPQRLPVEQEAHHRGGDDRPDDEQGGSSNPSDHAAAEPSQSGGQPPGSDGLVTDEPGPGSRGSSVPRDEGAEGLADEVDPHAPDIDQLGTERLRRRREEGLAGRRDTGDRFWAGRVSGAAAFGASAQAADTINNNYSRAENVDLARSAQLDPGWLATRTGPERYVAAPKFDQIRAKLEEHCIAVVVGADGTGRFSTACAVLAELCGTDEVWSIDLDEKAGLSTLMDRPDVLQDNRGHVLELHSSQSATQSLLRTLSGSLRSRKAFLLVVASESSDDNLADTGYAVRHRPPPATEVIAAQLRWRLADRGRCVGDCAPCTGGCAERYVRDCLSDPEVAEHLAKEPRLTDVVALAERLVEIRLQHRPPSEALDLLPEELRKRAAALLAIGKDDALDVRAVHRTLAFRIAYAVFYDNPMTVVFDAAEALYTVLSQRSGENGDAPAEAVFSGRVDEMVSRMRGPDSGAPDGSKEAVDRRARITDPKLASALLDVAWNDHDRTRQPLLQWLFTLGADPRQEVRLRAAQAAGCLAIFDFSLVYGDLIRPWASSPRVRHRQSASWALEFVGFEEPRLTYRLRRQLRDWARSPNAYLNDTAVRAYATALGAAFGPDMMASLRQVAEQPAQLHSTTIASAVAEIFGPEAGSALLETLWSWATEGGLCLRVHAARAVLFLARRTAPAPNDAWPLLLRLAEDADDDRRRLADLWRAALTEAPTAMRAWEILLGWLVRSDRRGDLEPATERFLTEVLTLPVLRARADFHLRQWRTAHPDLPALRRLQVQVKGMGA